jgi:hypothetical protein
MQPRCRRVLGYGLCMLWPVYDEQTTGVGPQGQQQAALQVRHKHAPLPPHSRGELGSAKADMPGCIQGECKVCAPPTPPNVPAWNPNCHVYVVEVQR